MVGQEKQSDNKVEFSPQTVAFWTAIMYAFVVLILGGGAGIWLPALIPDKTVGIDAMTTFVMATLAPVLADLVLDSDIYGHTLTKFWRVTYVAACLLAGALAVISLLREHADGGWAAGIVSATLAILVWVALALKSGRFLQINSITGSFGGPVPSAAKLPGKGLK